MKDFDFSSLNLQEKEEKILKAAIAIFSEKGFSAATTSEIAKSAGVAEGTIFRYFKTKKDILRGILIQLVNILGSRVVLDSIRKILNESDDKDLRTLLREILYDRLLLIDSVFPMARILMTEALHHEDVRNAIYENIINPMLDSMTVFYNKMVSRGLIRNDITAAALLRCVLGNFAIFIAQRKLFPDKLPMQDFEKELEMMLDVTLQGISAPTVHIADESDRNAKSHLT